MTEIPSYASREFRALKDQLPDGLRVSERIVDPLVKIRREKDGYRARLFGKRFFRAETIEFAAPGLEYDWALDGDVVRPLPVDTPAVIATMFEGLNPQSLSFADVIGLVRVEDPVVSVQAEENVFSPAREDAESFSGEISIPGLNASLYPYQARGVEWMLATLRRTSGLVLADEMGLGKTIQIIALLLVEKPTEASPALILCPTSLIANWKKEIFRFGPELSIMVHRGPHRTGVSGGLQRAQIVITTYDTFVSDLAIFQGVRWSWLILDEAQAVKNPDSARRQAVASVPRTRSVPMTGTPVETSLVDMWSLADIAIPGMLGSCAEFLHMFPDSQEAAARLARITDPIVLRRRVADVAGDLPPRIDVDIPLELGPDLAEHYGRIREETLAKYPVAGGLVATGLLQIFCAHPWLRPADPDREEFASIERSPALPLVTPKMERTIGLIAEAFGNRKKVLVFALFNRCGDLIREAGRDLPNAYWGAINGSTAQEDRQRIVDEFTDYEGPGCLILNPKAAGAGLNIAAATIVIHYTLGWNPALEAQASARAHRRGQSEPVYIYRLYYEGTVERVMIDRSEWRRELGNEAVPVSTRDGVDLKRALEIQPPGIHGDQDI